MTLEDPVELFEDFLRNYEDESSIMKYRIKITEAYSRSEKHLTVLFEDVRNYNVDLAEYLLNKPKYAILDVIEAFKNIMAIEYGGLLPSDIMWEVRISTNNASNEVRLRQINVKHIEKLIYLKAIVIKVSPPKPQIKLAFFECEICQTRISIPQKNDDLEKPEICSNPNCTNKKKFILDEVDSEFFDYQKITIQESPDDLEPGATPRTLNAILKYGLIDLIRPGERVKIHAIYRSKPQENSRGKKSTIFSPYLDVNNIEGLSVEEDELNISDAEYIEINRLSQLDNIHHILVNSIAPSIYGCDHLKMAALMSIFGGVQKITKGGTVIRGDIHTLFMGDPGTGKSQILQFCSKLISRSIYTSGKGASAAGLTAAVVRDGDDGNYSLEAGALVLASGGIATIDEFDKMEKNDRSAIHQAMEQQTISISKAGINATLQAKTAIIAAANPKYGRYNSFKSPVDNINLPAPILSRFDLVFIVQDIPEPDNDQAIADFIVGSHMEIDENIEENSEVISLDLLRKYIHHARSISRPKLTRGAAELIKNFYLTMRRQSNQENAAVAIVARYLEGLIRMAEANAKMALRDHVLESDAEISISLMNRSLKEIGFDPDTGTINIDRLVTGQSSKKLEQVEIVLDIIKNLQTERNNRAIKLVDLYAELNQRYQISIESAKTILDILINQSAIYNPQPDEVKLMYNTE